MQIEMADNSKPMLKQTEGRGLEKELNLTAPLPALSSLRSHVPAPHSNRGTTKACQHPHWRVPHYKCSDWLVHGFLALFHQSIDRKDIPGPNTFSTELLETNLTVFLKENIFLSIKEERDQKQSRAFLLKDRFVKRQISLVSLATLSQNSSPKHLGFAFPHTTPGPKKWSLCLLQQRERSDSSGQPQRRPSLRRRTSANVSRNQDYSPEKKTTVS